MTEPLKPPTRPYSLTEDQLHRMLRARDSMQVIATLLEDTGHHPLMLRKFGNLLEMASEELDTVVVAVEKTYSTVTH